MRHRLAASILALALLTVAAAGVARAEGGLHLYNWRNYTSPELIAKSEAAHDVKVTLTEYDAMAEALETIRTGGHGFDLMVIPADTVAALIGESLLMRTRPDRMKTFANVAARWRNPPWDRNRRYSVPWQWGGIGMVVDAQIYGGDIDTSAIIFNPPPELEGRINVAPERRGIIGLALLYLGLKPCAADQPAMQQLKTLLAAARPKWRSMEYGIAERMAGDEITAAAYWNDAARRARQRKPSLGFAFPREGFVLWMDNLVVLEDAVNVENARLFQNFVMAPENAALITAFAGHANGIKGSQEFLPAGMRDAPEIAPPPEATTAGVFLPACPSDVDALHAALWRKVTGE